MLYREYYDKVMISLFDNVEEADKYIEGRGIISIDDKIKYLKELFQIQLVSKKDAVNVSDNEKKRMDYYSMLNLIIFHK